MPTALLGVKQNRRFHPFSVSKNRHSVRLKRISNEQLTEVNARISTLIKAADEGRRRSTILPPLPLEREPTFHRHPRGVISLHNPEEAGESHWQRKYKKVSVQIDRKVVTHLRKKLNKRLDDKYNSIDTETDEESQPIKLVVKPNKKKNEEDDTIFSKYSDVGDRISGTSKKSSKNVEPSTETTKTDNSNTNNTKTVLPEINSSKTDQQQSQNSTVLTNGNDEETAELSEDDDILDLTQLNKNIDDVTENESFRDLDISPVQTPVVFRPITREQARQEASDNIKEILKGNVHRACTAQSKKIMLYISSGFTDTIVERTMLLEKVYPSLKTFSFEHGFELEIFDLHWGLRDDNIEDHSLPDTCLNCLKMCTETQTGVNVLLVLGDKYGPFILPSEIPADEFQAIYEHAMSHRQKEVTMMRKRVTEIAKAAEERERKKQQGLTEGEIMESSRTQHLELVDESLKIEESPNPLQVFKNHADMVKREQAILKAMKVKEESLPSPHLLPQWYKLDENRVPSVYVLQNISSIIKEFNRGDPRRREAARLTWNDTAAKLRKLFDEFADVTIRDKVSRKKYFSSLFDMELEEFLLNTDEVEDNVVVVNRSITDMYNHLDDSTMADYADLHPTREKTLAPSQSSFMNELKSEILVEKVNQINILPYSVEWVKGGITLDNRPHQIYLERMIKQVQDNMKRAMAKYFDMRTENVDANTKLYQEVSQHASLCQERSQHFQGRKQLLQLVKSYTRSLCRLPLILYGRAGSGKTAVVCKAAQEINKWLKGKNPRVIVRVVGRTTSSCNVRTLLRGICLQMCHVFDNNSEDVPTEYKGLFNDFAQRMSQASKEMPLLVVIDALDQLSEEHDGNKLTWLPKELPPHVKLILTTNPDDKYECLTSLRKMFGESSEAFIEIPNMPCDDAQNILRHWLDKENRALNEPQVDIVLRAFEKCPYPLYLMLAFQESKSWASFTDIEKCKLSDNILKLASLKFGKLETKHGEPMVRRALGYITASREGVTSNEMEDLLSLDEAVMDDIMLNQKPPKRRLPSVMWILLLRDLDEFLTPTLTHGVVTYRWAHSQFFLAAEERYLLNRDKAQSYHKAMAEYFMGVWAKKPKPYIGNEKGTLRNVSEQVLYYEPTNSKRDGSDRVYNIRKVNELPHHLLLSQQTGLYKSEALCNFEWVHAKLCGTSLRSLVEEYQIGLSLEPNDQDLKLLSDAIQLSAKALTKDPRQLASQLVGRLYSVIANDVPRAPGDPPRYPFIHALFRQAQQPSLPVLVPSVQCLTEPGGILFDLLSGHSEPITAVEISTDGGKAFTASRDNTMKMWNLRTGKVMKTIDDVGRGINIIRVGYNTAFIITVEENIIQIWNLRYAELLLRVDKYPDPPVIGMASEGKYLCALFDGNNMFRTWNLNKPNCPMVCETKTEDHSVFKDHSALIAPFSFDDKILHASRGANLGLVQNVRNGKLALTLKCNDGSSAVTSLAISRDYYILACRQHYMQLHEIYQLELFDLKKGKYLRSVRGCMHDKIKELHINYMGSHAIAICASEETNTSDIAVWNIETEDHKHLARHSGASVMGACADFRYCLTAGKADKTLRIWNLTSKINQSMPRLKKQLGVSEIISMNDNPRYVIARQFNNGPVSVWNVARAKCLKNAVRIERSLSDSSDVVVVRDTKVIILTGKGIANAKDNARPVFQNVLIYDLLQKKFVKKIQKCYITPCPAHEYVILNDDMLLGLSENRSHLVIWSLKTGQVEHRMRPMLKDLEKKILGTDVTALAKQRCHTAKLTPWERRAESNSARQRRREAAIDSEKERVEELKKEVAHSGIDRYMLSGNQKIAVASFFAHFMCVFDIENHSHLATLESENSMLSLLVAAITFDGKYLVQANYDEEQKTSYVTLWDCFEGQVKKRLKNETNVMALGINEEATKIVIGKGSKDIHVWEPYTTPSLRKIKGFHGLEFNELSKIFLVNNDTRAVVFAGDISIWDLDREVLLAVFSPDTKITCCNIAMNGQLITFGLHDLPDIVILKLASHDIPTLEDDGKDMFGEKPDESSDDDDMDEDDD